LELETQDKFRSEAEYLILNVNELGIKGIVLASPPLGKSLGSLLVFWFHLTHLKN